MKYLPANLALGGGGLKGVAHLGILRVFEEEGFPIEYIAGSSAGAFIGALYASGHSIDELMEIALNYAKDPPLNFKIRPIVAFGIFIKSLLDWLKICEQSTRKGLVDGKQLDRYLENLFGDQNFENLRYPLMVTAVDLKSGRLQVFTSESLAGKLARIHDIDCHTGITLATALRASVAIPGIIPPHYYQDMILVDGGVKDNVPADLLRFANADNIVAIDLTLASNSDDDLSTMLEILLQTVEVMGNEMTDLIIERYADLAIRPKIDGVSLTDAHRIQEIYEIGYQTGRQKVNALRALLKNKKNF